MSMQSYAAGAFGHDILNGANSYHDIGEVRELAQIARNFRDSIEDADFYQPKSFIDGGDDLDDKDGGSHLSSEVWLHKNDVQALFPDQEIVVVDIQDIEGATLHVGKFSVEDAESYIVEDQFHDMVNDLFLDELHSIFEKNGIEFPKKAYIHTPSLQDEADVATDDHPNESVYFGYGIFDVISALDDEVPQEFKDGMIYFTWTDFG
jgi:hypothetical protein